MPKRSVAPIVFLTFLTCLTPPFASGNPITFLFTGNVTFVDPELSGTFNTTQTLTGSYTFDSTLADGAPGDTSFGIYLPLTALDFTIGAYTATLLSSSFIVAIDGTGGCCSQDEYGITAIVSGANVIGLAPDKFLFRLRDLSGTAFNSDALPLAPPALSGFGANRWQFLFPVPGTGGATHIEGEITSLTSVPEPGTLLLLGAGLLGVAGYGRRKLLRKSSA
jgi:hypothetical protein